MRMRTIDEPPATPGARAGLLDWQNGTGASNHPWRQGGSFALIEVGPGARSAFWNQCSSLAVRTAPLDGISGFERAAIRLENRPASGDAANFRSANGRLRGDAGRDRSAVGLFSS